MRAVADHGRLAVKDLIRFTKLDRTKVYFLVGELRDRGLLVDNDHVYELASPAVRELVTTLPTGGDRRG
jgi:DNA-binding IclR family transcriptional regulator